MTSLDSAHETIAIFNRQIAEAEGEARQHVERLVAAGLTYDSEQVKKAWDGCECEDCWSARRARVWFRPLSPSPA